MRVCYFGTYAKGPGYPRNAIIIQGLRANGVEVIECRSDLWDRYGTARWASQSRPSSIFLSVPSIVWAYVSLLRQFRSLGHVDAVIVGYMGQIDVFLARLLTRRKGTPLILDAFHSLYDIVVTDRQLAQPGSWKARAVAWLDRASTRTADLVLVHSAAYISFYVETLGCQKEKFAALLIGADLNLFSGAPKLKETGRFEALFVGSYIPLQGIETILQAAHLLREDPSIRITFLGTGMQAPTIHGLAEELSLTNVTFIDRFVPPEEIVAWAGRSDCCLGIFGTNPKASRCIPHKVFDALAMGKPIVTAESESVRELLVHGENAFLVTPGDPEALALALRELRDDPLLRARLAEGAERTFLERCHPSSIGRDLLKILAERFPSLSAGIAQTIVSAT